MANNLNNLEIFKKAFEQFQASNNYFMPTTSSSHNVKLPPIQTALATSNTISSVSTTNSNSHGNHFSISKILQSNNEIVNKPDALDSSLAKYASSAIEEKKATTSHILPNKNSVNSEENDENKIRLEENSMTSVQKEQNNHSKNNDTFTSISSLTSPEKNKAPQNVDDSESETSSEEYEEGQVVRNLPEPVQSQQNGGNSDEENSNNNNSNTSEEDEENEEYDDDSNSNNKNLSEQERQQLDNRERRTRFNNHQQNGLYKKFNENPYPKEKEVVQIANELGLKPRVVAVWFQNTRQKNRKKGGSIPAQQNEEENDDSQVSNTSSTKSENNQTTHSTENTTSTPAPNPGYLQQLIQKALAAVQQHKKPPQEPQKQPVSSTKKSSSNHESSTPNVKSQANPFIAQTPQIPFPTPPQFPMSPFMNPLFSNNPQTQPSLFNPMLMYMMMGQASANPNPLLAEYMKNMVLQQQQQNPFFTQQSNTYPNATPPVKVSSIQNHSTTTTTTTNHSADSAVNTSMNSSSNNSAGNRRVRTKMTRLQLNMMRLVFAECKSPTQSECETLGNLLDLNKKVIQTWFQNHRAKEKKHTNQMSAASRAAQKSYILMCNGVNVDDLSCFEFESGRCVCCNREYGSGGGGGSSEFLEAKRAHLFSRQHIDRLREFVNEVAVVNNNGNEYNERGDNDSESSQYEGLNNTNDNVDCFFFFFFVICIFFFFLL